MKPAEKLRLVEAILFASAEPVSEDAIAARLPGDDDVRGLIEELADFYRSRGVNLVEVAGKWAFRTAQDLSPFLRYQAEVARKLSRAAVETLAIIAYHQPVTRAEVEDIRGVAVSKGTMDILFEANWIRPIGRRRSPGRPVTWGTSQGFLDHFGLKALEDLPGLDELKKAGLLDSRPGLQAFAEGQMDMFHTAEAEQAGEETVNATEILDAAVADILGDDETDEAHETEKDLS